MRNKKEIKILGVNIWRICAYFIIYSVVGFIIETLFALIFYNVLESRKSFLYGPFCGIYGVGAVFMILFLNKYFNKNNHILFLGGIIVGSIIEYLLSWIGEIILNVRWWDYSSKFLNINGRICLLYSLFWGLLAVYLMKVINPRIDRFIDWCKKKVNIKIAKMLISLLIIFLIIDCIASGIAISLCLIRKSVENDLNIENKEATINAYNRIYGNENLSNYIYKYWNDQKMIITYPNLTVKLADGTKKYIKDLTPGIKPYYYKFKERNLIYNNENINSKSE